MTITSEMLAALIFLVFGLASVLIGWSYGPGTLRMLGAGAMPVLAGGVLTALGAVQMLRALRAAGEGKPAFLRSEMRPLIFILVAVAAFAVIMPLLGLVPALLALVAVAWFADTAGRPVELAAILVVTLVLNVGIFVGGLGLPFRLFTWGF